MPRDGEAAREWWQDRTPTWHRCTVCNEEYPSRAIRPPLFCSTACYFQARRISGATLQEATCLCCERTFLTDKWRPRKTCGKSCAKKVYWATLRGERP
jgi:hypothetical protein